MRLIHSDEEFFAFKKIKEEKFKCVIQGYCWNENPSFFKIIYKNKILKLYISSLDQFDTSLQNKIEGMSTPEKHFEDYCINKPDPEYVKQEVLSRFHKEFIEGHYMRDPRLHAIVVKLIGGENPYKIIEELIIKMKEVEDYYINISLPELESEIRRFYGPRKLI